MCIRDSPIINEIGVAPVIALTATATDKVRTDIKKNLGIMDDKEFKSSFKRPNLYYEVRPKNKDIASQIIMFIRQHKGKSGIIYCLCLLYTSISKTIPIESIPNCDISLMYCFKNMRMRSGREKERPILSLIHI